MVVRTSELLPTLYEADETAWLEAMSEMIRAGRLEELDYAHLMEYLADMARRDKREVLSRLASLIAHLLKWEYQPDRRSGGWRATIEEQRQQLEELFESAVLRVHAQDNLEKAYDKGVKLAAADTNLPKSTFPPENPFSLDTLLRDTD
jgi:hypothetical protein